MSERETSTFDVIPAIDLRGDRVVRLERGDFERETQFGADAAQVARDFVGAGARWIHVVDLDGAREGRRRQTDGIRRIVGASRGASVEVAGGLRDASAIDAALVSGAARVVLGTIAITEPSAVADAIDRHGRDRVAVALDIRDARAVGGAWRDDGPSRDAGELLSELTGIGVSTFIVTAIARDGLLGGPDLDLLERCVAATDATVIASGGVTTIDDLRAVRRIGCGGAIVGRAIYDGRLDLAEAIEAMETGLSAAS